MKVLGAIVVTMTLAWSPALASHLKVLQHKLFLYNGQGTIGQANLVMDLYHKNSKY